MDHTTNESSQSTWDDDEEFITYGHKRQKLQRILEKLLVSYIRLSTTYVIIYYDYLLEYFDTVKLPLYLFLYFENFTR